MASPEADEKPVNEKLVNEKPANEPQYWWCIETGNLYRYFPKESK